MISIDTIIGILVLTVLGVLTGFEIWLVGKFLKYIHDPSVDEKMRMLYIAFLVISLTEMFCLFASTLPYVFLVI